MPSPVADIPTGYCHEATGTYARAGSATLATAATAVPTRTLTIPTGRTRAATGAARPAMTIARHCVGPERSAEADVATIPGPRKCPASCGLASGGPPIVPVDVGRRLLTIGGFSAEDLHVDELEGGVTMGHPDCHRPARRARRRYRRVEPMSGHLTRNRLNRCIAGAVSMQVSTSMAIFGVTRYLVF